MNRTIKDASASTIRAAINFASHRRLRLACNFGLKTLAPYEFVCEACAAQPERFSTHSSQQMLGNIYWHRLTYLA
jgi:hypothetical protein